MPTTIASLQAEFDVRGARRAARDVDELGDEMDEATRSAVELDAATQGLSRRLRDSRGDFTTNRRAIEDTDKAGGRFSRTVKGMGSDSRDLGTALTAIKFPGMIAGFLGAATAAASLSSSLIAVAAAAAPLAGLGAAIPQLGGAAAQGFGVAKLASLGFAEALKATTEAQKETARGGKDNAREQRDAARQVVAAQESLVDAQRRARDAQVSLTTARVEARHRLQELRFEVERGALSEKRASLSVAQARERLNEVRADRKAGQLERADAQLSYEEAVAALTDVRRRREQTAREYSEQNRRGVSGSREVVAAQQGIADAQRGIRDATVRLQDAQLRQREVSVAAAGAMSTAQQTLNEAMAKLAPNARTAVRELVKLQRETDDIRRTAQQNVFAGVLSGLSSLRVFLPTVRREFAETSGVLGGFIARLAALAAGPHRRDIERLLETNTELLGDFADAGVSVTDALLDITAAGRPLAQWLGRLVKQGAAAAAQFIDTARATGGLDRFMQAARRTAETWGRILFDAGRILVGVGRAAFGAGEQITTAFGDMIRKAADWTNSIEGQRRLKEIFEDARQVLVLLAQVLGTMAGHAAVAVPLLLEMGTHIKAFGDQHPNVAKVGAVIGEMALIGKVTGLSSMAASIVTIAAKAGPLGAVALGIGAIGAAAGVAYLTNEDFRDSVNGLFTDIEAGWRGPKEHLDEINGSLKGLGGTAGAIREDLNNDIKTHPGGILNDWLVHGDPNWGANIGASARDLWTGTLKPLWEDIGNKTKWLGEQFEAARPHVANFMDGFRTGETGAFTEFARNFGAFARGIVDLPATLAGAVQGWVDFAGSIVQGIEDFRAEAGRRIREAIVGWFREGVQGVKDFLGIDSPSRVFMSIGQDIVAGLIAGISSMPDTLASIATDAFARMLDVAKAGWQRFTAWAKGIPASFAASIAATAPRGTAVIGTTFDQMRERARAGWATFTAWAKGIPGWFAATIAPIRQRAADVIGGAASAMKDRLQSGWSNILAWARAMPGGFERAIGGLGGAFTRPISRALIAGANLFDTFMSQVQSVASRLGVGDLHLPKIGATNRLNPIGRHQGGPIPAGTAMGRAAGMGSAVLRRQAGGGVPLHLGIPGQDSVPAILTPREYVLTPQMVDQYPGGLRGLEHWRRKSNTGRVSASDRAAAGTGDLAVGGQVAGLMPAFLAALRAYSAGIGRDITVTSGFRTRAQQAALFAAKPNLAAPPGRSHHETGMAADIVPQLGGTRLGARAGAYGLRFPMSWEPWHIEPVGAGGARGLGALFDPAPLIAAAGRRLTGGLGRLPGVMGPITKGVAGRLISAATDHFGGLLGGLGGGGLGGSASANRALGQRMAAARGWTGRQWSALDRLIMKESGWRNTAQNPTSTARGIFQFLNSTWASVGARKTDDPRAQIAAGLRYIGGRYGTPSAALAFHNAHNWYGAGGPVGLAAGGPTPVRPGRSAPVRFSPGWGKRAYGVPATLGAMPAPSAATRSAAIRTGNIAAYLGQRRGVSVRGGFSATAAAAQLASFQLRRAAATRPMPRGWERHRWLWRPLAGSATEFYTRDLQDPNRGRAGYIQTGYGWWAKVSARTLRQREHTYNATHGTGRMPRRGVRRAAGGPIGMPRAYLPTGFASGGSTSSSRTVNVGERAVYIDARGAASPADVAAAVGDTLTRLRDGVTLRGGHRT